MWCFLSPTSANSAACVRAAQARLDPAAVQYSTQRACLGRGTHQLRAVVCGGEHSAERGVLAPVPRRVEAACVGREGPLAGAPLGCHAELPVVACPSFSDYDRESPQSQVVVAVVVVVVVVVVVYYPACHGVPGIGLGDTGPETVL